MSQTPIPGVPMGDRTTCAGSGGQCDAQACCNDNGHEPSFCGDHTLAVCVYEGGTPQGAGTQCTGLNGLNDSDLDGVPDPCDNCPNDPNGPFWGTCTAGLVGQSCHLNHAACDTFPGLGDGFCSEMQEDAESDGVGDVCDNCPNTSNPTQADADAFCETSGVPCDAAAGQSCAPGEKCVSDGGNACDNCDNVFSLNQNDFDGDCQLEPNAVSCGDVCDDDIDDDGVCNDADTCDYTPLGVQVFTAINHRLRGTIIGDLDGDCDFDHDEWVALYSLITQTTSVNGQALFEELCVCPPATCPGD